MSEQENLILRAWDKKSRKMREVDSIAFHNLRSVGDYRSNRLPKVVNLWGFNVITQQDVVIYRDIKDVELMRYTGKNDINGVKIFAGDIVKTRYGDIGIVEYSNHFLEWRIKFYKGHDYLVTMYKYGTHIYPFVYPDMSLKVIGNKYENKEVIPA